MIKVINRTEIPKIEELEGISEQDKKDMEELINAHLDGSDIRNLDHAEELYLEDLERGDKAEFVEEN